MKTLDNAKALLQGFETQFGIPATIAQQGSAEWMKMKLGVISASNAYRAVAKKDSETRATYLAELVAQVCTGVFEEINSKHMDWGKQLEDPARATYELITGNKVSEVPFVFKDATYRIGCSPDGFVSDTKGIEIKCPWSSVQFIKFATNEKAKPEWNWQNQFSLWVAGVEEWDFAQFDPRMKKSPIHIVTIKRDPEKQKALDELIPEFIKDMDAMLKQMGVEFGEQWKGQS